MAEPTEIAIGPNRAALSVRLLAAVGLALLLVAGVVMLGRLASTDRVAMVATGAFFGLVGLAVLLLASRRRDLLVPLGAAYGLVALVTTAVLLPPLVRNKTVNEAVAMAAAAPSGAAAASPTGPVQVAAGPFVPVAHEGRGKAALVRLPDGSYRVTLTDFTTDNGPDLRVYLVPGAPKNGAARGSVDLGALKGNRGNQQYTVPARVDPERFGSVVVWCRAFAVAFVRASLS